MTRRVRTRSQAAVNHVGDVPRNGVVEHNGIFIVNNGDEEQLRRAMAFADELQVQYGLDLVGLRINMLALPQAVPPPLNYAGALRLDDAV